MKLHRTEILRKKLEQLQTEVNTFGDNLIQLHQQDRTKGNLSFSGREGRIYVQPISEGYDISLSGKVLEEDMFPFMADLCGTPQDGYKQTRPNFRQPFWRTPNFDLVRKAVIHYSKTKPKTRANKKR